VGHQCTELLLKIYKLPPTLKFCFKNIIRKSILPQTQDHAKGGRSEGSEGLNLFRKRSELYLARRFRRKAPCGMGSRPVLLAALVSLVFARALAVEIVVGAGVHTLQAVIHAASDGDVLRILPGTYGGTGYCGVLVNVSVSISGNEAVSIDCEGKSRIWDIRAALVVMEGLIFKNGKSSSMSYSLLQLHALRI